MFIYDYESNTPHEIPPLWNDDDYDEYHYAMIDYLGREYERDFDPDEIDMRNIERAYNCAMEHGCVEKDGKLYASMRDINAIVSDINEKNKRIEASVAYANKDYNRNRF